MSDLGYLVWFIAMAVVTATLLTVGMLVASDVMTLPSRRRSRERAKALQAAQTAQTAQESSAADASDEPTTHPDDRHHTPRHRHAA